ncbi:protein NETWORKED 4A-like isoform X4 [Malus sylvestris]|uniref:protein NETWORKED 4A-like isoform X4 n=1 Tax=Malus sylvestris TaxID=3752 RepID=UPI0021ACFE4B|nr:protein NETWORKED 4A-like isoform X4 [Malus sylvestris]
MVDMERTELKKSDSAGLDNSISPDSSMWLVENLEEMDQSIKQMMKLIKEDGDSLPNKDETFLQKKPELVQEFQRMYRSLVGCYEHLNKVHKGFGDSEYGFNQGSPLLTPDAKHGLRKSDDQVVGFDISLSSDGSSPALTLKNGAESSSSSSLGSESDSPNSPVSNYLVPPPSADFDSQGWQVKIAELETELSSLKEKLQVKESDLTMEKMRVFELQEQIVELENRASDRDNEIRKLMEDLEVTKARLKGSDEEIANLKHELADRISKGADQMQGVESQLDLERKHVSELQERIVRCNADIFGRDLEVMQLKSALREAQEQFSLEKADLQADISSFAAKQIVLDTRLEELSLRNKGLEDEIRQCETDKMEMERLHAVYEMALQDDISSLKVEVADKNGHVEAVNKDLDILKLKCGMLMAEKDELNARAQTLMANVSCRDNQIQEMAGHLSRLQTEHESARRLVDELKTRVEELQQEVKRQSVVISDGAEEKREVIRQLCFSLEHYRSGYQELRQAFTGHRQRLVCF